MSRRINWQAGLAGAHAGLKVNQFISQLVTTVFVAGDAAQKRLSEVLRQGGYQVIEGDMDLGLIRHVRPDETKRAEPIDLLVLDTTQNRQSALDILEAVRQADWALPVVTLIRGIDLQLEEELRRLGVSACFDLEADPGTLHTAITALIPPIVSIRAAA